VIYLGEDRVRLGIGPSEAPPVHPNIFEGEEVPGSPKFANETAVDIKVVLVRGLSDEVENSQQEPSIVGNCLQSPEFIDEE
jgi:hypothetical protein